MVKVLLSGCNGKMGQVITALANDRKDFVIAAGVDPNGSIKNSYPVYSDIFLCRDEADVVIDFSHPSAFNGIMEYCRKNGKAVVMATTGLSEEQSSMLDEASKSIPVFRSANMSLGVNLLISLCRTAAKFLQEGFDIEIIEKHHNQKIDAPSGTAMTIADSINQALDEKRNYVYDRHAYRKKRDQGEIGIHAIRGGTITGEHSVIFAGHNEIIELKHEAMSKDIFAIGAINAAVFMKDKPPGMYGMDDMIEAL